MLRVRSVIALGIIAAPDGDPAAKRAVLKKLCRTDPRVKRLVRDVALAYFNERNW